MCICCISAHMLQDKTQPKFAAVEQVKRAFTLDMLCADLPGSMVIQRISTVQENNYFKMSVNAILSDWDYFHVALLNCFESA